MNKENNTSSPHKRGIENINWITKKRYPSKHSENIAAERFLTNKLLAAQTAEVFAEIQPYLESVSLAVGDYIYQPEDQIDFIYFPETAIVSEFQILEDGRTIEIAMTGNEGILGLLPIFNSHAAINWTQISISGTAARINRRIFEKKLYHFPSFQKSLFEYIGLYIAQISHRSICNCYHHIEQRFCSWLLMLQDRKKTNKLHLTQEQIARALGVHRPSLTHIAQILRENKIINYSRGKIYILDQSELEKRACPCFSEIDRQEIY
jgi:CRP-like cAMP-binding protein